MMTLTKQKKFTILPKEFTQTYDQCKQWLKT